MKKTMLMLGGLMTLGTGTALAQDNPFGAPTVVYNVNVGKSLVYVVTRKDSSTVGSGLSHDHAVRANKFSGTIGWNNMEADKCNFNITVQVDGLENDSGDMRRTAGLPDNLTDDMRAKIRKAMMASDQLDGANHSTMAFQSTSCTHTGGTNFKVVGDMTIRGSTVQVTVPMDIKADGTKLGATGSFSVNGSEFGIEPKSAAGGTIKNLDKWTFHVTFGAQK